MSDWISIEDKKPENFPVEVAHFTHKYKFITSGIDPHNHAPNGPWFNTNIPGMSMNATHWRVVK